MEKSGEVDLSGKDPMVKRILGAMYKSGYDQIIARFSTAKEYETAQEVVREEFIGFEIVHHEKNSLTIRRVSQLEVEEFDTMIRRMFLIIKSMGEDIVEAQKNKDKEFYKMIYLRDKDVNKIADFCRRVINKYLATSKDLVGPLYFIVEQLEKIGDYFRDMAKWLIDYNKPLLNDTIYFMKELNKFFEIFYNLYFKFDLDLMAEFGKKRYKLKEELEQKLTKPTADNRFISSLVGLLESIFDMNGPLMAIKI